MGIDARMLVRNRGRRLSESELQRLSGRLKEDVPAAHCYFTVSELQTVLWPAPTLGAYRAGLARDRALYPDAAEHFRESDDTLGLPDHLQIWMQDVLNIISVPDEQLIDVRLAARYFAPDYLRGLWPDLLAIADWLEEHFPDSEVWYGGDTLQAYRLTRALKEVYSAAFEKSGGRRSLDRGSSAV